MFTNEVHKRIRVPKKKSVMEDSLDVLKGQLELDLNIQEPHKSLTLMEEILLLGLKNEKGYASFWNFSISSGLRGCVLIELCLRGRLELDKEGMLRKGILKRNVLVKNNTPTGDGILDSALRHIKSQKELDSVPNWIDYLTGDTWDISKLSCQLKNVRERLTKNLVEKGVLAPGKSKDFILFDISTHHLVDSDIKTQLITKIQDALLKNWINDPHRMDKRLLSLIIMAQASQVIESAFVSLENSAYELATTRVKELCNMNFEAENRKHQTDELMWAVFAAFK